MSGTECERALECCCRWLRAQHGELAAFGAALSSAALRDEHLDVGWPLPLAADAPDPITLLSGDPKTGADALANYPPAELAAASYPVVLDGLLTAAVRADDLVAGAALLRTALLACGARRPTVARAIGLLLVSARPDGGFGVTWRGEAGTVRVPVTVDCAWALAEYHRPRVSGPQRRTAVT